MSTSKSSNPEEQLAHGEFIEQICFVNTPDDNDNDGTPENNDNDGEPTVDELWPALKYNSYDELRKQIKDKTLQNNIEIEFRKLCSTVNNNINFKLGEHGVAYLLGREKSQSTLVFVPKNSEGVVVVDEKSVFDWIIHSKKFINIINLGCNDPQLQPVVTAYKFAEKLIEFARKELWEELYEVLLQDVRSTSDEQRATDDFLEYWMNDDKEELEKKKTSTPSAPGDIDVSGGGTDTEKAESASNGVISMLKSTVSTVKRKFSGALSNISPHCHDDVKILPSNDPSKSTDTEESELSAYPDSGSLVAPPKVKDVLTGGKRKGGSKPARRKKKRQKSKSKNDKVDGGARVVRTPLGKGEVRRACLKHAVFNLFAPEEMKRVHDLSLPFPSSPDGGDVTIEQGNTWLMKHGMKLNPVTDRYRKEGGILFHLLKDSDCRLVIKVKLTMHDGSGVANHFFAYDGTTLHDEPDSIKPSRADRKEENCLSIFQQLFPKERFSNFRVTNVFELV